MKKFNCKVAMEAYQDMNKMRKYTKKYENADDRRGYGYYRDTFNEYVKRIPMREKEYDEAIENLNSTLEEVQHRCRVRTITVANILDKLIEIDEFLDFLSKKDKNHIKVVCDLNGQKFPNAYNGRPESTFFEAEFVNGKWNITDIYRGTTNTTDEAYITGYSEGAIESIVRYFSRL